jgi:hypothetical protein
MATSSMRPSNRFEPFESAPIPASESTFDERQRAELARDAHPVVSCTRPVSEHALDGGEHVRIANLAPDAKALRLAKITRVLRVELAASSSARLESGVDRSPIVGRHFGERHEIVDGESVGNHARFSITRYFVLARATLACVLDRGFEK